MAWLTTLVGSALRVVALFSLVNLCIETVHGSGGRHWVWVNLHWLPEWLAALWLAAWSFATLGIAHFSGRWRTVARVVVGSGAVLCAVDLMRFVEAWQGGLLRSELPIPLSLVLVAACGWWARHPPGARPWKALRCVGTVMLDAVIAVVCVLGFLVVFGASDYRRSADVIVVFGAGVDGSGQPSRSLRERLETGCRLYQQGYAPQMLMSGGQGEGVPVSESVAMMRAAVEMGVPESAIVLDEAGVNTLATVANCAGIADQLGWSSFLMVSHDYHLARIKMFCERAGLRAFTVPAEESRPVLQKSYLYLRELAAVATYYFLPGLSP